MMTTIPVVEIFGPTCQGEGPEVGARCIFVRVKGCSFRCEWCDSKFTWNDHESEITAYAPDELAHHLLEKCFSTRCSHIVLTGGNPCIYDFTEVLKPLTCSGITIDVETQGDLFPSWLSLVDTIVFSPKAPSSGMPDTYEEIRDFLDYGHILPHTQVAIKIPIFNEEDIEFARRYAEFTSTYARRQVKLYLSVGNTDTDTTGSIRDRVLADYEKLLDKVNEFPAGFANVYLLPQLHTLVWGNKQGV